MYNKMSEKIRVVFFGRRRRVFHNIILRTQGTSRD